MRVAVFVFALLLAPFFVSAHGAGAFFETTIEEYVVDVGFSSPAPEVGESVVFDFQLRKVGTTLNSGSDMPFTDVWVRIESEGKTFLATGLYNAEFGGPRISYVFPEEGTYTIHARYENALDSLVETSFPIVILPETKSDSFFGFSLTHIGVALAGCILGVISATSYLRRNKRA